MFAPSPMYARTRPVRFQPPLGRLGPMATVGVIIFHAEAAPSAGPLEGWVAAERRVLAENHRRGFESAGAAEVRIIAGVPDGLPFGARLRAVALGSTHGGLVVLGSG